MLAEPAPPLTHGVVSDALENDYVLSADEKPSVQARSRRHPSRPPGPGRHPMQVESEYRRRGTLAYLAAYDVHRGRVIGHCAPSIGIERFTALVDKVMTRQPYTSVRRVFWIVDNGASHRGWTAAARLTEAFANATMIHLPVHRPGSTKSRSTSQSYSENC